MYARSVLLNQKEKINMNLEDQKEKWKLSVSKGNILINLESIKSKIASKSLRKNELYTLIGRFNDANRSYELGTVKYEDFTLEISKIRYSVLELIDRIDEEDILNKAEEMTKVRESLNETDVRRIIESYLAQLNKPKEQRNDNSIIENRILILSNDEGIFSLKSYFNSRRFANVDFINWDDFRLEILNEVEIVILNNMDLPSMFRPVESPDESIRKRIKVIRQAVDASSCYFIHYGNMLYLINEYRERINAANSIFTLFTRVKEIADFANTYKIEI